MIKKLGAVLILSALSSSLLAGPIFNLVGSGGIAPPHPDGDDAGDRMVVSGSFGITTTGGGFMDGRLTLVDGFQLPTVVGGTVTIQASDIEELSFQHTQSIYHPNLYPGISFVATAADILLATGTIVWDGIEYSFTNASNTGPLHIETSISSTWTVPIFGTVSGGWFVNGSVISVGNSGLNLVPSSQTNGRWELTGFSSSSVPEPTGAVLLLSGLLMLGWQRRSRG